MPLRKLAHRLRDHDWLNLVLEIVIVVVGVYLGLQASNWNEDRQHHAAAREYVARIREDLATNILDLKDRIHYYQQVREHGLAALAAFEQPPETLGAPFLRDAYEASQIIPRAVGRNTYDEILSVGAVNWIADVAVRKRLANYYLYTESVSGVMSYVPPYRENLRRRMPYAVQLAITSQCPETISLGADGTSPATLAGKCTPDLPEAQVKAAVASVYSPDLLLDLNRVVADMDIKLALYRRVIERATILDRELAKQSF